MNQMYKNAFTRFKRRNQLKIGGSVCINIYYQTSSSPFTNGAVNDFEVVVSIWASWAHPFWSKVFPWSFSNNITLPIISELNVVLGPAMKVDIDVAQIKRTRSEMCWRHIIVILHHLSFWQWHEQAHHYYEQSEVKQTHFESRHFILLFHPRFWWIYWTCLYPSKEDLVIYMYFYRALKKLHLLFCFYSGIYDRRIQSTVLYLLVCLFCIVATTFC